MAKYKDADELLKRLNACKYPAEKPTMRQATYNAAISDACRIVDAIPAVDIPRWIPVTERLPEVGSEVLVCYDFNGIRSVYISNFYGDGEFHGLDDEYLTNEGRRYRKAVAWMPLPKPYKEGEEE